MRDMKSKRQKEIKESNQKIKGDQNQKIKRDQDGLTPVMTPSKIFRKMSSDPKIKKDIKNITMVEYQLKIRTILMVL